MDETFDPKKTGGVPANALIMPIAVLMLILHILIIILLFSINQSTSSLSRVNQESGKYRETATSLLAGSSLLCDTSVNFVVMPVTENGAVNVFPLTAYAEELKNPRRGKDIVEQFRGFNVTDDIMETMEDAAGSAEYLVDSQIHAITLLRTIYPIPDTDPYNFIPVYELTAEEKKMSDEEKTAAARALLLGSEYAENKQNVSEKVNLCVNKIQEYTGAKAAESGRQVAMYRTMMWMMTLTIITILIITFAAIYTQIIKPLVRFAELIPINEKLDEKKGSREVRLVAAAYNSASRRRDALDEILRTAAEKDQLTNLPNRYRYEQYKLEVEDGNYPVAVFIFDIDYLKKTNDEYGHRAGDRLIRDAAESIATAFADRDGGNCFRMGGDEFIAVVTNCTEDSMKEKIRQFRKEEKAHRISISMGYAYTRNISETNMKCLMDEADKRMYSDKNETHKQEGKNEK